MLQEVKVIRKRNKINTLFKKKKTVKRRRKKNGKEGTLCEKKRGGAEKNECFTICKNKPRM